MTHSDVIAQDTGKIIRQVQHGVVLDIGVVPDDDAVDVAAQHGVIPDAGMRPERDIPNDDSGFGDVHAFAELRFLASKVFGSNLVLDCKKARGSCVKPWSLLPKISSSFQVVPTTGLEPVSG